MGMDLRLAVLRAAGSSAITDTYHSDSGKHGGLVDSAFSYSAIVPGSSSGRGYYVVNLDKTLYSHGASLHPGV